MFELIDGGKRPTLRERFERAMYLDRAIGLTRAQRLGRALVWASVGSALTMVASALAAIVAPEPPVKLLEPVIEHASTVYTVYRLRMAWRGTEKSCELVVYHDRQTWRLTCDPR